MASSTVTLTLGGAITLQAFGDTLRKLEMLLSALVSDVSEVPSLDWLVTDLRAGSATVTLSGQAGEEEASEHSVSLPRTPQPLLPFDLPREERPR